MSEIGHQNRVALFLNQNSHPVGFDSKFDSTAVQYSTEYYKIIAQH